MPLRIGILDIAALIVLLVVIFLPERSSKVDNAYPADEQVMRDIALYQARLAVDPGDADAAAKMAELLTEAGQTDWAVQVAGEAAEHADTVSWRALLAISIAHAERIEVGPAYRYAQRAMSACEKLKLSPSRCPAPEFARLSVYLDQLEAGVKSGIDPRIDPAGFQNAVLRAVRMVRMRGATPTEERDRDNDKDNDNDNDKDPDNSKQ
ncbi:MAG: hypothetical protein MJE77_23160 [Proteobacteria bacterium]|nr:hypothetical protein [Pseudomonadota bacterium]